MGLFKVVKAAVMTVGAAAAAYGIKKAYDDDFEEVKEIVKKGKDIVSEHVGSKKDYEDDVTIIDETFEYEG